MERGIDCCEECGAPHRGPCGPCTSCGELHNGPCRLDVREPEAPPPVVVCSVCARTVRSCETIGCGKLATHTIHWPGRSLRLCSACTGRAQRIARVGLGFDLTIVLGTA